MKPIIIVLTEGYSDWEVGVLSGVGRSFYGADVSFASPRGRPLVSAGGLAVSATNKFRPAKEAVVVVCSGTLALARAGLLDNVKHTSNSPDYIPKHVPLYRGADLYVDQAQAIRDGNVITASAPAPASFAMEVLMAAGLEAEKAKQIPAMLAAEHTS